MDLLGWNLIFMVLALMSNRVNCLLVDLGHGYRNHSTTCWKADSKFEFFGEVRGAEENWYAVQSFAVDEHCGTHLDAPYHFNRNGWTLDEIPLERLIVEGVHVDVRHDINENGDFLLTADHLKAWEQDNGPLPRRSVVLVNFGWSQKFGNRTLYYNNNTTATQQPSLSFPGLSKDAAQWIVDSGKVYGLGVDGPSVDPGNTKSYDVHKILSKANIYNLENVALNGTTLPPTGFKLIIQPMKIIGGTGGPCRILALNF